MQQIDNLNFFQTRFVNDSTTPQHLEVVKVLKNASYYIDHNQFLVKWQLVVLL